MPNADGMQPIADKYVSILTRNADMSKKCSYGTGGKADYYFAPDCDEVAGALISDLKKADLPYFILGGGSRFGRRLSRRGGFDRKTEKHLALRQNFNSGRGRKNIRTRKIRAVQQPWRNRIFKRNTGNGRRGRNDERGMFRQVRRRQVKLRRYDRRNIPRERLRFFIPRKSVQKKRRMRAESGVPSGQRGIRTVGKQNRIL